MAKQEGNNIGETEFLNSDFGVINQSTEKKFHWFIEPDGVLGKRVAENRRRSRVVRGLTVVALTKKGPGISPWLVIVNTQEMEVVHLFMSLTPDSWTTTLTSVLKQNFDFIERWEIERMCGLASAEMIKTAASEVALPGDECAS